MKKIVQYGICLMTVCGFVAPGTMAQTVPRPGLWFSFNGANYTIADYGSATVVASASHSVRNSRDRFYHDSSAANFWIEQDKLTNLVTVDPTFLDPAARKLFGFVSTPDALPNNFTISCWVYVDGTDLYTPRKIFYTDNNDSRFALIHKGADIYLRRTAHNNTTNTDNRFDYYFGAPATFDAGTGWYQVILVMGKRAADGAKYTKLYVGKPGNVKYDATGPRVIEQYPHDVLASDFGGAYAFTGVQDFMNTSITEWGMGNADDNDPKFSSDIAPVLSMDDFAVWGEALTDMQAFTLFNCQKYSEADECWAGSTGRIATKPAADTIVKTNTAIIVYPNPVSNQLRVKIPAIQSTGSIWLTLVDLNGRTLYRKSVPAQKAGQTLVIDHMRSHVPTVGIYLLEVVTPGQHKTFKILVN